MQSLLAFRTTSLLREVTGGGSDSGHGTFLGPGFHHTPWSRATPLRGYCASGRRGHSREQRSGLAASEQNCQFLIAITGRLLTFRPAMAFDFTLDEEFPHLSKAPIVEAVVQINARATAEWKQEGIVPAFQRELGLSVPLVPENAQSLQFVVASVNTPAVSSSSYWQGVRTGPGVRPEIIRFTRDLFAYSRLSPYEHWEAFQKRAMEVFLVHCRIAQPKIAQPIGVRFINRIPMSQGLMLEDYFTSPPNNTSGLDLPISGFLHQVTFQTPNYPYTINVARTVRQTRIS